MDAVFRSKIDLWLVALCIGIPVLALEFALEGTDLGDANGDVIAGAIVAVGLAFIVWWYLTTRYTISAEALLIKSGPFLWIVPLREISAIEPTRNPASAPALSLDRLRIHYGGGAEIMVSPADKAGFMTEMKKHLKC